MIDQREADLDGMRGRRTAVASALVVVVLSPGSKGLFEAPLGSRL